jgi:hypothetical protein
MLRFTLDTNCLYRLEDGTEPHASAVRHLSDAAKGGKADVAFVAATASENQTDGGHSDKFSVFRERLQRQGLDHLNILKPLMYFDFAFSGQALWSSKPLEDQERQIHEALFKIPFDLATYLSEGGNKKKWRNKRCDVQIVWCHLHYERDVLVTTDKDDLLSKSNALASLGVKCVCSPTDAVKLLD